jgi:hypothetical protein
VHAAKRLPEICVRRGGVADKEAQGLADPHRLAEREHAGRLVGAEEAAHEKVARVVLGPVLVDHEPGEKPTRGERPLLGGEGGDLPAQALERRLSGKFVDDVSVAAGDHGLASDRPAALRDEGEDGQARDDWRRLAREGRAPNGAGRGPVGEPESPELVIWHEFLDQRKELSLLKPDVRVKQLSRRLQRLSIDTAGRHGDFEFASEPLELHVLDACLAEGSRLRRDVPEKKREELFFLIPKVDTLFVPEELPEFPGRRKPSRSISVRGSTAQPQCLHESVVMIV